MIIKNDDLKCVSLQRGQPDDQTRDDQTRDDQTRDGEARDGEAHSDEAGEVLYYEDLSVGQSWVSPARQITADDVTAFSELTGDFDPLHNGGDASEAHSPFGRPVAHGLLGLSVLAGLSTEFPRAATLALVGISDWQFDNPIFFGETVHVVTEVTGIQPHGRRAGRVTWLRKLISDDGRTLQQGRFVTLVASESRKPAKNAERSEASRLPR